MFVGRYRQFARLGLAVLVLAPAVARTQAPSEGKPRASNLPNPAARARPVAPTGGSADLDDTVALGAFMDGAMRAHFDQLHIPAAVAVVIKDGRVLFARGYGSADYARGTPVDPATSLFRIGSISKLFTWTAVMQLVEQGKLNLDTDVNTYLKEFKIPPTFSQPVTLRSLMTHTPGFEDGGLGYLILADSSQVQPIAVTLEQHMPQRVRPPLELSSYSNYGAALAGLIVQDVSGLPFNEYIRQNILDPLDMHHATFQEPVLPEIRGDVVTAYVRENGVFVAKPFEYVAGFRPAGSGSFSGLDMTHFMIAHLQGGRYGNAQILQPKTVELMHSAAFANDPRLPAMDLGFYQQRWNGQAVIGHEGDTEHFHSAMFLIPDHHVGIFLSYDGDATARDAMLRAFFDRYFPAPAAAPVSDPSSNFLQSVAPYLGAYRFARHSSSKIDKVVLLAEPTIHVSPLPKQSRLLITGLGDAGEEFAPVSPGLFQQVEGHREVAFKMDSAAHVMRLSTDDLPFMGTEPVPWNEVPSRWLTLIGISALMFLATLLTAFYRRRDLRAMPRDEKRAEWLQVLTAAWFFLTIIAIGAVVAANSDTISGHIPASLRVVLGMPVVFLVLTVLLVLATIRVWMRHSWAWGQRVRFTLVALAAVIVCLFFNTWNLLGWRFG